MRKGALIDPATKLMVKMAIPINGKRTFFISKNMAEAFRKQSVLERREEILLKRSSAADEGKEPFNFKLCIQR
jgi:hypothetical protein